MEIIKYKSLVDLHNKASELGYEVFMTNVSHSFRLFENKQAVEFHVFYIEQLCGN